MQQVFFLFEHSLANVSITGASSMTRHSSLSSSFSPHSLCILWTVTLFSHKFSSLCMVRQKLPAHGQIRKCLAHGQIHKFLALWQIQKFLALWQIQELLLLYLGRHHAAPTTCLHYSPHQHRCTREWTCWPPWAFLCWYYSMLLILICWHCQCSN